MLIDFLVDGLESVVLVDKAYARADGRLWNHL